MREFHIVSGVYKGDYKIYEGKDEFYKDLPGMKYWKLGFDNDIETWIKGAWIETLDGYFVQTLNIKEYLSKTGLRTKFVKVPMGTFAIVKTRNKGYYYQKLFGQFSSNAGRLSTRYKYEKREGATIRKQKFAHLLILGIDPVKAYIQCGYKLNYRNGSFINAIGDLMQDKTVVSMVKKEREILIQKLQEDERFSDENMIQYIKDFMKYVMKGSQTHLNSIIPLLKLLNKLPEDYSEGKKPKREVQEAEYNTIPPEEGRESEVRS